MEIRRELFSEFAVLLSFDLYVVFINVYYVLYLYSRILAFTFSMVSQFCGGHSRVGWSRERGGDRSGGEVGCASVLGSGVGSTFFFFLDFCQIYLWCVFVCMHACVYVINWSIIKYFDS